VTCGFALAPGRWEQLARLSLLRLSALMVQQGKREVGMKKALTLSDVSDGVHVEFYR